jgi:serine/threonine protein kinase/Tfp pilus assembly protein PilF
MSIAAGSRLGQYEVLSPLGAGGMGEVYRARDTRLSREVAIKVLPAHLSQDADALSRFEREAKAVAALSHPNILAIHDFGEDRGIAYAVMELLEGETLRERLDSAELPLRKALEYGLQIAQGLAAAHERGIVHRDLKPENVFLTRDGVVKILDFGLAKPFGPPPTADEQTESPASSPGTLPGTVLGTVGYMSPEQVRGGNVDHRSDVFSFGAILYEMVTGQRAFRRDSEVETMMAILREEPPEISRAGIAISTELEEIVAHCLEKSPEERFQSVRDLAFALRVVEREGRSGDVGRPGSAVLGAAAASESSIAVLPFRNMSTDRENEYFSDGMTEEIINALTKIEALHVASRTSSFAFKGKDEDVRKIGAALGVRTVLEGSVRQSGRKIRITAQLINVADGYHLWSDRYDREIEDVFAVQDEIALAITETLKVRLLPKEEARLASRATENVEAYNDYLKGRYYFNRREPVEAIREFERAIERDPRYMPAYTGLADSYCIFGFYGGISTQEAFARARQAAEKARQLEPESPDVHVSLALVEHYFGWDLRREEVELRRAIELAPRSGAPYSWLGLMLSFTQRLAEGLDLARRAAELEPLSANVQTNVAWNFFAARRFDEAVPEFQRALHIDPNAPYPLWAIALTYQRLGRHTESIQSLEKAAEITSRRQPFYLALLGGALAAAGRRSDALALLGELKQKSVREYIAPFHLSFLYVALGEVDEAIDCLERACAERNAFTWWIRESSVFDPLRSHPRFTSLLDLVVPG